MTLTDLACRKAKPGAKLRKLSDSGGLQLWVFPNGSALWRLAYRFGGRQKLLALGRYPQTGLQNARTLRDEAKKKLATGVDPSYERRLQKLVQGNLAESFDGVAKEFLAKLEREGRSESTLSKTKWLLDFATPIFGQRPVASIQPVEVLAVLKGVEARGRHDTAQRLRSTLGAVFRYAIATARAQVDPTVALQGALVIPKRKSRSAITKPERLGALLRAIDDFDGQLVTRYALQLLALLFPRPGELRAATWQEFDLKHGIWTIPPQNTKVRREHRIPLPPQAVLILERLQQISGRSAKAFPSVRSHQVSISEGTMNAALRRLGYSKDEVTPHGFRATASTLLNESGYWHPDAVERQLGHMDADEVRRAYARSEYWDERVKMMRWWADYLDELRHRALRPSEFPRS